MRSYVFITGASAGIGKAYAYAFAQRGYNLVLVARRLERLEEIQRDIVALYGVDVRYYGADITERSMRERVIEAVDELPLEVVINNAGFGDYGAFECSVLDTQLSMVALNIQALIHMTHALLPVLHRTVATGRVNTGYVMNIGSVAGFIPGPYMANYFATKAYVLSFSEALAQECVSAKKPIHVCVVCPGPTQSEFVDVASMGGTDNRLTRSFRNSRWNTVSTAESLAEYSIKRMFKKRRVIIYGVTFKILEVLCRMVPRSVIPKIMSRLQATHKKNTT